MKRYWCFLILLCSSGLSGPAFAQHPVEIEREAANGDYYRALVAFEKLPQRRATPASIIAAGKSAWALGLNGRAAKEFDRALREPNLPGPSRARLLLSRGAIEFQEGRYQVAALFAEKGMEVLAEPSPLRAQIWSLWGQSLAKLGAYGPAEEKFTRALGESAYAERIDIYFMLGECQKKLGRLDEARLNLEQIPLEHERAPAAIRLLAQIALEQKRYPQAGFWLTKGRTDFSDAFLDSWVDYALVEVAIRSGDGDKVRELASAANARYTPSDSWLVLLNSAAEAFLWKQAHPDLPASIQGGES